MRDARTARAWIRAALALQLAGLAFDGLWHGLLRPGVEPATFAEMLVHLASVHLPLYLGVAIHLRLSTQGGPLAEGVAVVGFFVAVTAVWVGGRQEQRRLAASRQTRRAA
jgi:hypothetical protein